MRYMRSLLCAGLAMVAVAVCASMPAAADVPPEITVMAQPVTGVDYPAPAVAIVSQDVATLPRAVPDIEWRCAKFDGQCQPFLCRDLFHRRSL